MKNVKHCLFAAITVLLLMIAFGGSAFAFTITIDPGATSTNSKQPTGHTYKAYQIFSGIYDETNKRS